MPKQLCLKTFRDNYAAVLIAILVLISFSSNAQVHDPRAVPRVNSFTNGWKGGYFDSVLHVPRYAANYRYDNDSTPFLFVVGNSLIYFSQGSYYNVSGGSSIDTTSLSARINLRVRYSDTAAMLLPYLQLVTAQGLFYPLSSNPSGYSTLPNVTNNLQVINLGNVHGANAGLYSARPAASNSQNLYIATDSLKIYYDNGTWLVYSSPGGGGSAQNFQSVLTTGNTLSGNNTVNIGTGTFNFNGTSGFALPIGTTAQRPTASTGFYRSNSDSANKLEEKIGSTWFRYVTSDEVANFATTGALALKVNISDTAAMLSPYLRSNIAAATYQPIGTYLNNIGVLNSNTKDQKGATITGSNLVLQTADSTFPGLIDTAHYRFLDSIKNRLIFDSTYILHGTNTTGVKIASGNGSNAITVSNLIAGNFMTIVKGSDSAVTIADTATHLSDFVNDIGAGGGGGGGSTNLNIGSGFRLAVSSTNNIKTVFGINGAVIDSITNTNALTISIAGLTNSNLSGSAGITNANLLNSTISGVSLGANLFSHTNGYGLLGSVYNGSASQTWTADTASNHGLVSKDYFAANNIASLGAKQTKYVGTIMYQNTWSTGLAGYTNQLGAASATPTGGKLVFSGGTSILTQSLDSSYTNYERWVIYDTVIVGTKSSIGGFGDGVRSYSHGTQVSTMSLFNISNTAGSGLMALYTFGVQVAVSTTPVVNNTGDTIILITERKVDSIIVTGRNKSTNSSPVTLGYRITPNSVNGTASYYHNTGRYGLFTYGGNFTVVARRVGSNELVNMPLAAIGDSKTYGTSSPTFDSVWTHLLRQNVQYVGVFAGASDQTADVVNTLNATIATHPQQVILYIGINDIGNAVPSGTWQGNIISIVSRLQAAGISVRLLDGMYDTLTNTRTLRNFIVSTFPDSNVIQTYIYGQQPGTNANDSFHLNGSGELQVYRGIINSYKLNTNLTNYALPASASTSSSSAGTNTQIIYNKSGNLVGNAGMTYVDSIAVEFLGDGVTYQHPSIYMNLPISNIASGGIGAENGNTFYQSLSFGFSGLYGGTASTASGRSLNFFDGAVGSAGTYMGGMNGSGTLYWGPSSSNYSFNIAQPNSGISGTGIDANGRIISGNNAANSMMQLGSFELQPYSLNSVVIGDNTHAATSVFVHTVTAPSDFIQLLGTEIQFKFGASGTAGTSFTPNIPLKVNNTGSVAIGGNITSTVGTFTSATMLVNNASLQINTGALATGATSDSILTVLNSSGLSTVRAIANPVASASYTPTLTNTTNVTSSALTVAYYSRVGNIVTVQLGGTLTPTTALSQSVLTFTLPITTTNGTQTNCGTAAIGLNSGTVYTSGIANVVSTTTGTLLLVAPSLGGTTSNFSITFVYTL